MLRYIRDKYKTILIQSDNYFNKVPLLVLQKFDLDVQDEIIRDDNDVHISQ